MPVDVRDLVPLALCKALCDPTRVAILDELASAGAPVSVGEVAVRVDADVSVVSRNLGQLRDAGLLCCEREGRQVFYRLDTSGVVAELRALADGLERCCPTAGARGSKRS